MTSQVRFLSAKVTLSLLGGECVCACACACVCVCVCVWVCVCVCVWREGGGEGITKLKKLGQTTISFVISPVH